MKGIKKDKTLNSAPVVINTYQTMEEYNGRLKPNIEDQGRVYSQEDFQYFIQS